MHRQQHRQHPSLPNLLNDKQTTSLLLQRRKSASAQQQSSSSFPKEETKSTTMPGSPSSRGLSRSLSFRPIRQTQEKEGQGEFNDCDTAYSVRLIRSEIVTWTVSLSSDSGGKVAVPLTLALWDGPSSSATTTTISDSSNLPHSLRRLAFTEMPPDLFENFSTLFGIGQHITLSPSSRLEQVNQDLCRSLAASVLSRHGKVTSPWVVASILSSSLQTALNVAVTNAQARLPVFGVWGTYAPPESSLDEWIVSRMAQQQQQQRQHEEGDTSSITQTLFPLWMNLIPSSKGLIPPGYAARQFRLFSTDAALQQRQELCLNRNYTPPFLSGNLVSSSNDEEGMDSTTMTAATLLVAVLPGRNHASDSRLSVWGKMLLRHCPPSTVSVVLWGARHCYSWIKQQPPPTTTTAMIGGQNHYLTIQEWRSNHNGDDILDEPAETVDAYRRQCRLYAERLLEMASGATVMEPRWGPLDDPIATVHVTVTWNGRTTANNDKQVEPLISLPFVVRSRHKMSRSDWIDMEDSVERTLLDPFDPSLFVVQSHYDKDVSVTPLAASQRCILAALVRTATLPPEILMQHLTNEAVMDGWSSGVGENAAKELVNLANLHPRTKQLVEAMDWSSISDDMIESWEADQMVEHVFDGSLALGFPSPPEESFVSTDDSRGPFAPFPKAAPPGRMLSLLFLSMSKLHAPSSMALVWVNFVNELRNRWDSRQSLPNMSYVPGLDPSQDDLNVMRCLTSIGRKADLAAFVNCSEPDPDDSNCLIGQKLQVFNIGIESSVALEMQEVERMERQRHEEEEEVVFDPEHERKEAAASVASTEIVNNATGEPARKVSAASKGSGSSVRVVDTLPNKRTFGAIAESREGEQHSLSRDSTSKDDFHDAHEGRSLLGSIGDNDSINGRTDFTATVAQRQNRKGARCPVHGVSLVASGDQLYAPYLQRPDPVTDDIILERRMMLARQRSATAGALKVHDRIEIAHRLQKPKLLSDMRAFKAANPGSLFTDFINWYGNPGNPLDDYSEEEAAVSGSAPRGEPSRVSTAVKLDNASEAIQVLTSMRDFWSETWDEASPCPAAEQEPLFDAFSTVEMILNGFETMHPASLVNQIMAVNLASAYFTLVSSAGDALHVGMVTSALKHLRETTERSLSLLSRDVTHGTSSRVQDPNEPLERLPKHASVEAIRACDAACNALSVAETSIARAMSILHKFPRQYDLVQNMLRRADGEPIALATREGQSGILQAIHRQQSTVHDYTHPVPSFREYILRNTDEENPCQLCVRFGVEDDGRGVEEGDNGGVLLALTKTYRE